MSISLCNAMSTFGKYADKGANFIFGTGSTTIGNRIRVAVKSRNRFGKNDSFIKAVADGFVSGVKKDNAQLAKAGFFKSTWTTLRNIPGEMAAGFKGAKGLGKLTKSLKPLGKALPFAMNIMWIAGSLPTIIERTKDEGILGGLKETGKTLVKMGSFALGSALGMSMGGFGGFVGGMALSMVADKVMGEDYKVKKERLAAEEQEKIAQQLNEMPANESNYDPKNSPFPQSNPFFTRLNTVA